MTEKLTDAFGRTLGLIVAILAIVGPVVSMVVYFAQIGPTMGSLGKELEGTKVVQIEQRVRLDRIDESRSQGLQRLSAVEEASKAAKAGIDQINTKLDRLLFDRRR